MLEDAAAGTSNLPDQPPHVDIGIDHRSEVSVCVAKAEIGVYTVLTYQGGIVPEASDKLAELVHLRAMPPIFVDRPREVISHRSDEGAGFGPLREGFEDVE
jgi:hypothetical protein